MLFVVTTLHLKKTRDTTMRQLKTKILAVLAASLIVGLTFLYMALQPKPVQELATAPSAQAEAPASWRYDVQPGLQHRYRVTFEGNGTVVEAGEPVLKIVWDGFAPNGQTEALEPVDGVTTIPAPVRCRLCPEDAVDMPQLEMVCAHGTLPWPPAPLLRVELDPKTHTTLLSDEPRPLGLLHEPSDPVRVRLVVRDAATDVDAEHRFPQFQRIFFNSYRDNYGIH